LSSIIGTTKYLKDNFEKMKPENIKGNAGTCL
jgi:hypothetical protein